MPADEQELPAGRQGTSVAEQGKMVPVPVAARLLGKSPDAIRSAIRRGKLSATKGNDGDWRVWLPTVEPVDIDSLPDSHQQDLDRAYAELAVALQQANDRAATVAELRAELATVRQQAANSDSTAMQLRERLARIEGEAEGKRLAAVAELAAKDTVIVDLRAALTWHRTPWWRRLIG
jgi:ribosomal protein L29